MTTAAQSQSVLPRIAAMMRGDGAGEPIAFTVDGVPATAAPHGRGLRLNCEVLPSLPDDEAALRALMARYLPYADHGAEVMCADEGGRLLLVATLAPGDDVAAAFRQFCDAAVHWSGPGTRSASGGKRAAPADQPGRMPAAMIFP